MKRMIIALLTAMISTVSYGQENTDNIEPRMFGVGFNFMALRVSDYYTNQLYNSPSNNLMVEFTPWKFLRITPTVGWISRKTEIEGPDMKQYEETRKSLSVGGGIFGMIQKGQTNIYGGVRIDYAQIKYNYVDFEGVYVTVPPYYVFNSVERMDRFIRTTVAPTIGAEYFLGKHFSIGGEIQLRYMILNKHIPEGSMSFSSSDEKSMVSTDAGAQIRFYF